MHSKDLYERIKLNIQKLDTMLLNDIKLFLRDYKSLILVILTPLVILSILINIYSFSDVASTIKGVELGVCDMGNADVDLSSGIFDVELFNGDCKELVKSKVARGEMRGAVVIPADFSSNIKDGLGSELDVYVDNSKPTTALVTADAVKAYVADLNEKIGTAFILEAWNQLKILNENLKIVVVSLEKAKPVAVELRDRLNDVNADLESIDLASQQEALGDLRNYLDVLESQMEYSQNVFDDVAMEVPSFPLPVLPSIPTLTLIKRYKNSSSVFAGVYCVNISDPMIYSSCTMLTMMDDLVVGVEKEYAVLGGAYIGLNDSHKKLDNASNELKNAIGLVQEILDENNVRHDKAMQDISDLRMSLSEIEMKLGNATEEMKKLNKSVDKFLSDVIVLGDEFNKTMTVLDGYTQKDPATILQPVTVDVHAAFKDALQIKYRLPGLMSILLLFVTLLISSSMIVGERKGGTMARIYLSPISMFFFLMQKMMFLVLLCIVQIVSMLIASLVFGVGFGVSLGFVLIMLAGSIMYVSLGVFIGALSKSENTALLTSLVIGFPLMFMSGVFSPPELMGKAVRVVSHYLPLTMHINVLERVMIYGTGVDYQAVLVMLLIGVVLYLISALMIRKKPTLK